jgi:hypothetical protein
VYKNPRYRKGACLDPAEGVFLMEPFFKNCGKLLKKYFIFELQQNKHVSFFAQPRFWTNTVALSRYGGSKPNN